MTTKNTGTKKMPSTVAEIMPPSTPVPIAFWLPEPAPVLVASGSTPKPKASEVIRIGRSRIFAADSVASNRLRPWSSCAWANSTIRIAFLADRPTVVKRPTWKYTSLVSPRPVAASSAPITPSGTMSMTANGTDQLSYSAARLRKTTSSEIA